MIYRIAVLFSLITIVGCATHSVAIDPNVEMIPPDAAVEYLQSEGATLSNLRCMYTRNGIDGIAYKDLEFQVLRNMWGNYVLTIWRKGGAGHYTFGKNKDFICMPIWAGGWDNFDLTNEQVKQVVDKTSTALISLGVQLVNQ